MARKKRSVQLLCLQKELLETDKTARYYVSISTNRQQQNLETMKKKWCSLAQSWYIICYYYSFLYDHVWRKFAKVTHGKNSKNVILILQSRLQGSNVLRRTETKGLSPNWRIKRFHVLVQCGTSIDHFVVESEYSVLLLQSSTVKIASKLPKSRQQRCNSGANLALWGNLGGGVQRSRTGSQRILIIKFLPVNVPEASSHCQT